MTAVIRQLVAGDEDGFRVLRLAGLRTDPEAFGSSLAEEEAWSTDRYRRTLENNHVVGAFVQDRLVGTAGYYRLSGNTAHRGHVWGVVVDSAHRGQGIGTLLIEAVVRHASGHLAQLHLGVGCYNAAAIRLYQNAGFEIYGTEPRSLFVNGRYIDEHLMVRFLDKAPGK